MHRHPLCLALGRVAAAMALGTLALAGCGPLKYEAGADFDPAKVESLLHPGQSTQADVQAVLGAPYGIGSTMMPYHDGPRVTWSYFHDGGVIDLANGRLDDRLSYLFVFFRGDRLDSYLWFNTR